MYTFEELWALLQPKRDYDQLRGKCRNLWESFSEEKRKLIYLRIEQKKNRKEFLDYNPLFAIEKNSTLPRREEMSFKAYYAQFGTTEEQGGWKMVKPKKDGDPPVHYVKEN